MAFDGVPHYSQFSYYRAWGTPQTAAWLAYEFDAPKIVTKYVLLSGGFDTNNYAGGAELPVSWTFEGSNDNKNWTILDEEANIKWTTGKLEFSIDHPQSYKTYRINITKNNGASGQKVNLSIHEMEMWGYAPATQTPDPVDPTPNPNPTDPTQPTGDRAILTITMDTGLEKEFNLSMKEVNSFITWYEGKQSGSGTASYAIDKHDNNKGPFSNRKDYVIFNKILTFEVSEYSTK
ncbi:discoidin domain-containing protein [Paenibacillus polymyxa]|uniref:discoidin domain-containing protein n=1 Tax=Paenibacillus polymyxa TaxID=1406 RepID=UPI000AD95230|nr:discoidin domain-containing protein [Paenibacillus polymyxa]